MSVLILNESHIDSVLNLLKNRKKFSQQPISEDVWNTLSQGIKMSLLNRHQHRIIGYVDTELRAVVSQSFHRDEPTWMMNFFASDKNYNLFSNGHGDYINQCLLKAMYDAEEREVYDIYYSVPVQYLRTSQRTHHTSPAWNRYDIYIDKIIPPYTYPLFEMHKYAYGKVLKPHSVAIKHAVLKQEYRNTGAYNGSQSNVQENNN